MNHSLTVQNQSEKRVDPGPAELEYQKPVFRDRGRQLQNETQTMGIKEFQCIAKTIYNVHMQHELKKIKKIL